MPNLVIQIDGDAKGYEDALKKSEKETQSFKDAAESVAKYSAIAFAGLTAEIGFSVHAFGEAEQASRQLALALQNQGIYSDKLIESYKKYAVVASNATGIDDDAIIKAQAIAQTYLGQIKITQELTNAIADLSETMGGDLNAAAEKIGRTIGTHTNAFARDGLEISQTATQAEKLQKVLEYVNIKSKDLAETHGNAAGSVRGLKTAFDNLQEAMGQRFAPSVGVATGALTRFLQYVTNNDALVNFAAGVTAGGGALAGIVSAASSAAIGLNAMINVLRAMEIQISLTRLAVIGLAGATGIGLLVVALGTLGAYLISRTAEMENFKKNLPAAREEIKKLNDEILEVEKSGRRTGGGELLIEEQAKIAIIKKRVDAIKAASAESEAADIILQEKKKATARKEANEKKLHDLRLQEQERSHHDVIIAENNRASLALQELLQKRADTAAQIASSQDKIEVELLNEKQKNLTTQIDEQQKQDQIRWRSFLQDQNDVAQAMFEQYGQTQLTLSQAQTQEILAQKQTELDALRQMEAQKLKQKVDSDNIFLENEKRYGKAYAQIYAITHSEIYEGVKKASGELAALQESSNSNLKAIGKTAAIANIIIKTAESAMNIFTGFSTIPYVGYALGVAGAAAATLFGAEQIDKVTSAADGGLMQGGIRGLDSIPTLTMPGELVAPTHSYEEVVTSVAAKRQAEKSGLSGGAAGSADMVDVLKDISSKLDNQGGGSTHIHTGDVLADDSYIDRLVEKISDALQYRNAKLHGVNA